MTDYREMTQTEKVAASEQELAASMYKTDHDYDFGRIGPTMRARQIAGAYAKHRLFCRALETEAANNED